MKKVTSYKREKRKYLNGIDYMLRKMKLHILLLSLCAVAVIAYSAFCTIDMKIKDAEATQIYARNYTEQIADMVDIEIGAMGKLVDNLADSMGRLSLETDIGEFVNRKRILYGFDFIVFSNGKSQEKILTGILPEKARASWTQIGADVYENDLDPGEKAVKIANEYVHQIQNVYSGDKKIGTLWIGKKENKLRDIFVTKTLQKKNSVSYLVDGQGDILLSSEEKSEGLNLSVVFGNDESTRENIINMRKNIQEGKNGIFRFFTEKNQKYFLSYAVTETSDWVMATTIPANLFTGFSDSYVKKMLGNFFAAVVVYGAVFILLFKRYADNSRRIEELAFYDDVTGGINRIEFQLKYQELCRRKKADRYTLVLMNCMDFKMINRSLGVKDADQMLRYFYTVIQSFIDPGKGEFAARTEMDHFFLCLRELDPDALRRRLNRIVEEINSFRNTEISSCNVSFWMGACRIEDNDTDITILQDQIRAVMKEQSRQNVGVLIFYDRRTAEKIQRERELEALFEDALVNGDFQVYMQPKVDITKQEIAGAEALSRWILPEKGMISPAEFIPVLEQNGMIRLLDRYVFDAVCRWICQWKEQGQKLFPVSVNLSRSHFVNETFLSDFVRIADKYQIDRSLIEFEVTETIFLDATQINIVKESLKTIHRYGFKCSLDDFGVGYSSLALLKDFEIDVLKLDRTFFRDLESKKARDVITCIVGMAEKLNIKIVAEGIETQEQLRYLEFIRCFIVQGYFFSRPLPLQEFETWVQEFDFNESRKKF